MKTKKIVIIFICAMFVCFLLGAGGAVKLAGVSANEENLNGKDRLIGMFITFEPLDLFDAEGYFDDNAERVLSGEEISEGELAAYQGRLYASLKENTYIDELTGESITEMGYVFENTKGISFYCAVFEDANGPYYGNGDDEGVSDIDMAINLSDIKDSVSLEGTVYVSTVGGPTYFYCNPVYQTAQGEVYTVTGNGISYGSDVIIIGMSGSYELNEETTVTAGKETKTVGSHIKITVCYTDMPTSVKIIGFDKNGKILASDEYPQGELPEKLAADDDTEYIIVETHMINAQQEESVRREMFQKSDESLYAFYCLDDGICVKRCCEIKWGD